MSVMAETFQPAMGPYFATASVELASYCRTAVSRWALIVNMLASNLHQALREASYDAFESVRAGSDAGVWAHGPLV